METPEEWVARFKKEQAAKTPEQLAAEKAEYEAWLASLPVAPEHPLEAGEVQARGDLPPTGAGRSSPMIDVQRYIDLARRINAASTPESRAAHAAWLASLPVLDEGPLKPGEVRVIFCKRKPKKE